MDPGKKFPNFYPKKYGKKHDPEIDFSTRSVDGISTSFSSHSEVFTPYSCQSGYIEANTSADFDFSSIDSLSPDSLSTSACTKAGSKRLQMIISRSRPEEIDKIVLALTEHIGELMVDQYGNYMCQTLMQSCSAAQRLKLLTGMKKSMVKIACNAKGTHALQILIALANLPEEENIYQECFQGQIVRLSKDLYSSHVIQRLLVTVRNRHFVIKEILGNVTELAMDKLGLCVIKKCTKDPQIFTEILGNCLVLMQDPYGNYAVQNVLETWKEECAFEFTSSIQSKTAQLCIQKYASNVMEKAMIIENIRRAILQELIRDDKLDLLLGSPYGCYVLRTAALESDRSAKSELAAALHNKTLKLHNAKLQAQWDEILTNLR